MRPQIKKLWTNHRRLFLALCLAIAFVIFFGTRLILSTVYWSDPERRDQAIAGWMTPGYISHSWKVPPNIVREAIGLELGSNSRRRPLTEIASELGVSEPEVIDRITKAIAAFRANR